MRRPEYLLHPQHTPVQPLPAATLLLLREAPVPAGAPAQSHHWQVLMTRRSAQASFLPNAYVFPGGGLEAQDAQWAAAEQGVLRRATMPQAQLVAAIAAVRETWEELGVLLAVDAQGHAVSAQAVAQLDREAPLLPQLQQRGWQLDLRQMWQLCQWTADHSVSKRFQVPFWVARMPAGQSPVADECEQFEPVWVTPQQALEQHAQGRMDMIFPTVRTLEHLQRYAGVDDVLAALQQGPLWDWTPRSDLWKGQSQRLTEQDAAYGELAMVCPDGQVLHPLEWQSQHAVPLRRHIWRLTAPNANVMTGPGTNSYLVGEASTGFVAIDPGPADAAHVQRLWAAAGGDIRMIICTHSHADHAPGAWLLQALCAQHGKQRPLVMGCASGPHASAESVFVPDMELVDGQCLCLRASEATVAGGEQPVTHTLQVVTTPGHAANHLCLLLQEDGLLFSGDHVLNGSTTIVAGPDGHMTDYLESLEKLGHLCTAQGVEFILPAHGYVLHQPAAVIAQLHQHRLQREAKVLAAMAQLPHGSPEEWVALAYAETPQSLWPLALRSLMAHVERIRALGLQPCH